MTQIHLLRINNIPIPIHSTTQAEIVGIINIFKEAINGRGTYGEHPQEFKITTYFIEHFDGWGSRDNAADVLAHHFMGYYL